jgi:SAM-dependent methyltransferase
MSTSEPRPAFFAPRYAAMFLEPEVARAYAARPPYPEDLFDVLSNLVDPDCRRVLDVGAGPGDLARPLAARMSRVDAVDPSAAMIEEGRSLKGGDSRNLRWVHGAAETASLDPPYGLVVAGQSLAWMDWPVVFERWRSALSERGCVATVERTWDEAPWRPALTPLIAAYSANRDYRPFDLLGELARRGLYRVQGTATVPGEIEASVERIVEALHSQNGLARHALGEARCAEFDARVRAALDPFAAGGRLHVPAGAVVTWGAPL